MGTTTNNGWTYPESTDLVKDGATAIQTLADDIDTTLGVYAASTSGLTLINTTTFSGVASQQINSCFSTTYTNYKIILNITAINNQDVIGFRLGTSGSINTTSNYFRAGWRLEPNSGTVTNVSYGAPQSFAIVGECKGSDSAGYELTLWNPFATQKTYLTSTGVDNVLSGSISNGFFNLTTSFTDFQIYKDTGGTMTGTLAVYGFNK